MDKDPRAALTAGGVTDWIGVDVLYASTLPPAFWAKVQKDDCWQWTGAKTADGYGNFCLNVGGKRFYRYAHRLSYIDLVGEIPHGLVIDHLCRNRGCVNPEHLEPVTRQQNTLRGETLPARQVQQTHCVNGHEFTESNTYRWESQPRKRKCRACDADRQGAIRADRRAAP